MAFFQKAITHFSKSDILCNWYNTLCILSLCYMTFRGLFSIVQTTHAVLRIPSLVLVLCLL